MMENHAQYRTIAKFKVLWNLRVKSSWVEIEDSVPRTTSGLPCFLLLAPLPHFAGIYVEN